MNQCLTCGEEVIQKKGKRERLYCNDLCRVRYFQRHGKKQKMVAIFPEDINPNEAILKQIALIKAELIPHYRNSLLGRKSWEAEQRQRIIDLESKLI